MKSGVQILPNVQLIKRNKGEVCGKKFDSCIHSDSTAYESALSDYRRAIFILTNKQEHLFKREDGIYE